MPSPPRPRRVALYARVSHAREESRSVPEQLDELRKWANREGWTIAAELSDEVSASRYSTKARPDWQRVMDLINSGRVDTLALWEISRASRDRPVFSALVAACVQAEVKIATGGRLHDPADAEDGFLIDLFGALSVRESAMTSKRVRRDVHARAMDGRPHGTLPYGYLRVINPETGKTIGRKKHPEQAPVVREIVRRLLARNESADAIAADLNTRGIPTKSAKRWRGSNLGKIALNPAYAGLRVYHGRVLDDVTATWPALITVGQHRELAALFGDPERDKFRKSTRVKHLGSGIFRCGRAGCDGRMRVAVQVDRPNRYDCNECHRISRHQAPVDELVEALTVARLALPNVRAGFATPDPTVAEAAEEAARLRAKLDAARDAWEADELSLEGYTAMEARVLPKIRAARQRARPPMVPPAVAEVAGPDAAKLWATASIATRRAVVDALIVVTLLPVGRGGRPFDPESVKIEWKSGG